jgi:hypothetical protein
MRLIYASVHRAAAAALTLTAILAGTAGPAYAAAPGNDSYAGRVVVGAIPFSATVDTSEATTDTTDAELNADCGAPATDASIWYQVTAATDGGLVVDVSGSDYSAGAIVVTGSPGAWTLVDCGPGAVGWSTEAGTTYTILVFDDQLDGGGNGGTAQVVVDVIPAPPSIDITVDPRAQFTRSGSAIVSGTVTCDASAVFALMETELTQRVGRLLIRGSTLVSLTCDGTAQPWSVELVGENGTFAGGKAASVSLAIACGEFQCSLDYEERTVQLSRRA